MKESFNALPITPVMAFFRARGWTLTENDIPFDDSVTGIMCHCGECSGVSKHSICSSTPTGNLQRFYDRLRFINPPCPLHGPVLMNTCPRTRFVFPSSVIPTKSIVETPSEPMRSRFKLFPLALLTSDTSVADAKPHAGPPVTVIVEALSGNVPWLSGVADCVSTSDKPMVVEDDGLKLPEYVPVKDCTWNPVMEP